MFTKIEAKNFLSWENLEFDFTEGVTLIEGFNHDDQTSEGSGKSAILNALSWGLFGKIPKDANVDDVIREGEKSCSVVIALGPKLCVVRTRKPNDLYIRRNGMVEKGKDAKETQRLIEEEIGMSFDTFCQSVYFAQNYPNKFVTANEADKAKILSEIQDLTVFDKARKAAMARLKKLDMDILVVKKDLQANEQVTTQLVSQVEEYERFKADFEKDKKRKIKELEDYLKSVKKETGVLLAKLNKIDTEELAEKMKDFARDKEMLRDQKVKLKTDLNSRDERVKQKKRLEFEAQKKMGEIKKLERKMETYLNPKDKSCPTCGTVLEKIDSSHFEKHIQELKGDMGERFAEIEGLNEEVKGIEIPDTSEIEAQLKELDLTIDNIKHQETGIRNAVSEYEGLEKRILNKGSEEENYEKMIAKEEARTTEQFDKKIEAVMAKLEKREAEKEELEAENKGLFDTYARLRDLKDGFKEVKQYVFAGLLEELTRKSNRYLSELFELPVAISFSNMSSSGEASKIQVEVTIEGQKRPLGLYSGGQFRRIQLAVDLALSDIVSERGSKPMKLRIFDEYMKDLSESSMEKVLHLLESLKGSTILIEHNSIFRSIVNNTFKVELVEGVSRHAS